MRTRALMDGGDRSNQLDAKWLEEILPADDPITMSPSTQNQRAIAVS